jgi:hypothetical protein
MLPRPPARTALRSGQPPRPGVHSPGSGESKRWRWVRGLPGKDRLRRCRELSPGNRVSRPTSATHEVALPLSPGRRRSRLPLYVEDDLLGRDIAVFDQVEPGAWRLHPSPNGPPATCRSRVSSALRSSPALPSSRTLPGTIGSANATRPFMYSSAPVVLGRAGLVVIATTWTSGASMLRADSQSCLLHASTWARATVRAAVGCRRTAGQGSRPTRLVRIRRESGT